MSWIVFVLELPWELGVPDDYEVDVEPKGRTAAKGEERLEIRLRFRTVDVPSQLPLAASDLAFGSLDRDGEADHEEAVRREEVTHKIIGQPFLGRRTVAAAYVPSEDDPPRFESEPLSRGLSVALDALNAWLISLGVLYNDRIRPISLGDLAPSVPVLPASLSGEKFEHGSSDLFSLRKYPEEIRSYDESEMEQVERMLSIVASDDGLSLFYELIQRAGSARRADRNREAVIDYGTAGELFITTMLKVVGERLEIDPVKLGNLLSGPLADRARHLCRLLDVPSDPNDSDSPLFAWWLHCYHQRNGIVHKGADSMAALSEVARIGLVQMVVDVREAIRAKADISDLASMIRWGRRVDETGAGGDSNPDPLPPVT